MSLSQSLRDFIRERLAAAAEEILIQFDKTIVQYEEELDRQRRLLEICWKPQMNLHRIGFPQEEEVLTYHQERSPGLQQNNPEPSAKLCFAVVLHIC
ncbi:uncharacterized protein LOC116729558 isoform X2 [Xiphophorus hellerii]|uniref:uncharacterized protein LOC116729558 isoform X2 n=1 Tax=Xiphophorus hellerii TaxID=8084 RepID=UPI0013B4715E|nr:uncharacterized protein LOC116729558 isoform X2 [Xiphophorus hellerii]